jgi:hypothetical protein
MTKYLNDHQDGAGSILSVAPGFIATHVAEMDAHEREWSKAMDWEEIAQLCDEPGAGGGQAILVEDTAVSVKDGQPASVQSE